MKYVKVFMPMALLALAGLLCSCMQSGMRERGKRTMCLNNLKQLGLAMNLYAADNSDARPTNVMNLVKYIGGTRNAKLLMCPSAWMEMQGDIPESIEDLVQNPDWIGYRYLSATGTVPGPVSATLEPVMCDWPCNHQREGINILFADGHVTWWHGTLEDYARANSLIVVVNTNWFR